MEPWGGYETGARRASPGGSRTRGHRWPNLAERSRVEPKIRRVPGKVLALPTGILTTPQVPPRSLQLFHLVWYLPSEVARLFRYESQAAWT